LQVLASASLLKGRGALFGVGFLLSPFFWVVGAARLARPNSRWSEQRYDEAKRRRAVTRYGEDMTPYRAWYTPIAFALPVVPLSVALAVALL
jgi:hypothetical protein